jgi:hypothetical protein
MRSRDGVRLGGGSNGLCIRASTDLISVACGIRLGCVLAVFQRHRLGPNIKAGKDALYVPETNTLRSAQSTLIEYD